MYNEGMMIALFWDDKLFIPKYAGMSSNDRGNDLFYSEVNQNRLIEAAKRIETGAGAVHDLIEVDNN